MAHEWAEELHLLACEHHGTLPGAGRVILSREQMAAGERASGRPPYIGEVRPAGEGRWMRFDGLHWGPSEGPLVQQLPVFRAQRGGITFSVHPDVAKGLEKMSAVRAEWQIRADAFLHGIAEAFQVPIDLLRRLDE